MPEIAYLSLGSNVGDRDKRLRRTINRLNATGQDAIGHVISTSSFYETEPVEFINQAWFLNCVVALETNMTPQQLMKGLLTIEQEMGRRRTLRKGPRTIDIDILLFGDAVIDSPELIIPHPAMTQRRFVLAPLVEIAPEVRHPVQKKTAQELLDALPAGQVVRKIGS
jgi:2-amino-4-hydroxy-6-hydroxymethyldihydropteridine diphosphokinase